MNRTTFNIQDFVSNWETPVVTRDGRAVDIIDIDNDGRYPINGTVYSSGVYYFDMWSIEGKHDISSEDEDLDLFFKF